MITDNINAPVEWTAPGSLPTQFPVEHYTITRMGLPERPLLAGEEILQGSAVTTPYFVAPQPWPPAYPYNYGTFGLNRDLVVLSFLTAPAFVSAPANGFYAGIANPSNVQNNVIQVDPFVPYCGTAVLPVPLSPLWSSGTSYNVQDMVSYNGNNYICTAANNIIAPSNPSNSPSWQNAAYVNLYDSAQNWPALSSYYQVRIVKGTGAGQVRTIVANTPNILIVAPRWAIAPDATSWYEIGWANTDIMQPLPALRNLTWCKSLELNTATGTTTTTLTRGTATWTTNQFQGAYLYLDDGSGTGSCQARAIVSNTPTVITVTPAFAQTPSATTKYRIMESHGYVLITSGRASNRLFPIVWDAYDNTNGHLIVCAGTDFGALDGITAARRVNSNFVSGYSYNVQDATTFTVVGNQSARLDQNTNPAIPGYVVAAGPLTTPPVTPLVLNATPNGNPVIPFSAGGPPGPWYDVPPFLPSPPNAASTPYYHWPYAPPAPVWPPPWLNTLNIIGHPNRMALDQYVSNGTTNYNFEYSYGVVFSDSGTDPSLPVRVDVFAWRNFDPSKDFVENQKPVGHMAGYIKRP